jgi:hypothetical protein
MEFNVPLKIQEAFLDFLSENETNEFWHIDRWNMLRWESALDTLFIRCTDPAWTRSHPEEQDAINTFMRGKLGSRYQTAYLNPQTKKKVEKSESKRYPKSEL